MNDVIEKVAEAVPETETSSPAWIRAQFRDNAGDEEASETSPRDLAVVERGNENDDTPVHELDLSLQQLAAALVKVGELPARGLEDAWSQQWNALEVRLSEQTDTLATSIDEISRLGSSVDQLKKDSSEREDRQERVASQVEQLKGRVDAFEADLGTRLGQISSSIERLQVEITKQQAILQTLEREEHRRSEVAENVSQVLDSLKISVNMLGGSTEQRSS